MNLPQKLKYFSLICGIVSVVVSLNACHSSSDDSDSGSNRLVFVTQASINGDIAAGAFENTPSGMDWDSTSCTNNTLTGIQCANLYCQTEAEYRGYSTGLLTRFRAWLSDSNTSAKDNISYSTTNPYVRAIDTSVIVASAGNLIVTGSESANLSNSISNSSNSVWTGTNKSGTLSLEVDGCNDWTDNTSGPSNTQGDANSQEIAWTNASSSGTACNSTARLYCFEK